MNLLKLVVLCSLLRSLCPVLARAQDAATAPSSVADTAPRDVEQEGFRDPFAKEEEKNDSTKATVSDPLQPINRAFFTLNDKLYFWVLKPVAKAYNKVAPEPFRASVRRLFVNARYPVRAANNLLQGKFKQLGVETARFVVNSTVGIGGLFDPAREEWELMPSPEDLDQTLGFYHFPMGVYLHWPLLGPSSVRGTVGMVGDSFLSPWPYIDGPAVYYGTRAFDTVNSTSLQLGDYEGLKKASFDPYVAIRNAYFENRRSQVER